MDHREIWYTPQRDPVRQLLATLHSMFELRMVTVYLSNIILDIGDYALFNTGLPTRDRSGCPNKGLCVPNVL